MKNIIRIPLKTLEKLKSLFDSKSFASDVLSVVMAALLLSCSEDLIKSVPSLITQPVTEVTVSTAQVSGRITSTGNEPILERGFCWSTNPAPTIIDSHKESLDEGEVFTTELTRLCTNTTYYLRAYAVNAQGTAYGDEISFTTQWIRQMITISSDKLSYKLCDPIGLTITNNSPKDTLIYIICNDKLFGVEQKLNENGEWNSTFNYLCFLDGSELLLPLSTLRVPSARISNPCLTSPGTYRMQYIVYTKAGEECLGSFFQTEEIASNAYEVVE